MKTFHSFVLVSLLVSACASHGEKRLIRPDNAAISYSGRYDRTDPAKPVFMYSGCAIRTGFTGTSATLILKDDSLRNLFTVKIDDSLFVITANHADSTYLLARNLQKGKHALEIFRRTEWNGGNSTLLGLKLDHRAHVFALPPYAHTIEFIGNSYTCGYGDEGKSHDEHFRYETENNYLSYGATTARELNAAYIGVCRSGIGMYQGYGGDTSFNMPAVYDEITIGSDRKWDYAILQPDLVVINLLTNDLSVALDSTAFFTAYTRFVKRVRGNYPHAKIVCVAGPSGDGAIWQTKQRYIHTVVNACNQAGYDVNYFAFSPFEMHGSDWHPNVAEHRKMADELIPYVKKLMQW